MAIDHPYFDIGDRVLILSLDRMPARVVELCRGLGGWTYEVRYIHEGKAMTMRCFPDEVEIAP
jgi:hypothetical protein